MFTLRPCGPSDYDALASILNVCWPGEAISTEELRFEDNHRDPKCRYRRWVAVVDGQVVGAASHDQVAGRYHPRKFWLGIDVQPEFRQQGIGAALYDQALAAVQAYDPLLVRFVLRENMSAGRRFVEQRGYTEDWRAWASRLEVGRFDPTPFAAYPERVARQGIGIRSFAELADDPDRDLKLYTLLEETRQDAPMRDAATPWGFEAWCAKVIYGPYMDPDGYFVAVRAGEYLGISNLMTHKPNTDVETGWTGVGRAARGMGIAWALKLRVIEYARVRGYAAIRTDNNSLNYPMLAINERLGFVRLPAWVYYVKYLDQALAETP